LTISKFGLSLLQHGKDIYLLKKNNEWRGRFKSHEIACGYIQANKILIGWAQKEPIIPIVEHRTVNFMDHKFSEQ